MSRWSAGATVSSGLDPSLSTWSGGPRTTSVSAAWRGRSWSRVSWGVSSRRIAMTRTPYRPKKSTSLNVRPINIEPLGIPASATSKSGESKTSVPIFSSSMSSPVPWRRRPRRSLGP